MNLQTNTWRSRLHEVIFESNTSAGKAFDICLLISILASIAVVMLDSVASLHSRYGRIFFIIEWVFTILFTIEHYQSFSSKNILTLLLMLETDHNFSPQYLQNTALSSCPSFPQPGQASCPFFDLAIKAISVVMMPVGTAMIP